MNDHWNPQDEFAAKLARVSAARVRLDPQVVFYRAGYEAAMAENRRRLRRVGSLTAAASLAGLCLVATLAYRAGNAAATQALAAQVPTTSANPSAPAAAGQPSHAVAPAMPTPLRAAHERPQTASATEGEIAAAAARAPVTDASADPAGDAAPEMSELSAWWTAWLPVDLRPLALSQQTLTGGNLATGLVGAHSIKHHYVGARRFDSSASDPDLSVVGPEAVPPNLRLHPRDWQSFLPPL
ncbi:MAG: hypothetical protein ACTHOU_21435 [Aureliella sp.]